MFFNYGYGLYFLFGCPLCCWAIWAQMKVKSAFNQYHGSHTIVLNGADVARRFLGCICLQNVRVEQTNGLLSDHYDPQKKVLRLSRDCLQQPQYRRSRCGCS
jgi:Zn-dependent membrane protease YugP